MSDDRPRPLREILRDNGFIFAMLSLIALGVFAFAFIAPAGTN